MKGNYGCTYKGTVSTRNDSVKVPKEKAKAYKDGKKG